ncbi:hypothetical protein GLAREA_10518 [Glarea lozoyensis ATCC 20868]|uniref:Uncharacterized protein n=1 Tax=Glarea lozoyensis (strain ATCC 20868 / MF5171) TaxID=1116229 RepID=S3E980_GLAL2|nr:uncharacterized protein GLAREA_10518 [Glarea lozoyensis ATCC 20868]EPE34823.1 hypothetical protein GLAREA_10518 [Glarea lozoyensis ATCC 20868]
MPASTIYQTIVPQKTATSPATSTTLSFAECTSECIDDCRASSPPERPFDLTRMWIASISIQMVLGIYCTLQFKRMKEFDRDAEENALLLPADNDKMNNPGVSKDRFASLKFAVTFLLIGFVVIIQLIVGLASVQIWADYNAAQK